MSERNRKKKPKKEEGEKIYAVDKTNQNPNQERSSSTPMIPTSSWMMDFPGNNVGPKVQQLEKALNEVLVRNQR